MGEVVRNPQGDAATAQTRYINHSFACFRVEDDLKDSIIDIVGMDFMHSGADDGVDMMDILTDATDALDKAKDRRYGSSASDAERHLPSNASPDLQMAFGERVSERDFERELSPFGGIDSSSPNPSPANSNELGRQLRINFAAVPADSRESADSEAHLSGGSDEGRRRRTGTGRRISQKLSMGSRKSTANMEKYRKRLQIAKSTAFKQRLRVSGVTSMTGILLALAAAICFILVTETHGIEDDENVGDLLRSLSLSFLLMGIVAFLLALLPTDRRAVPLGAIILIVMLLIWAGIAIHFAISLMLHPSTTESHAHASVAMVEGCLSLLLASAGLATAGYLTFQVTCRRRMPKRLLARMWYACGVFFLVVALGTGIEVVFESIRSGPDGLYYVSSMMTACMCARVARNPDFRPLVQSFLGSRAEAAGSAAAVAALVGDSSVDKVLEMARMHFYTVRADRLTFEDLKCNVPDPDLGSKSRKTRLGEADAFISHSWRDDPAEKWNAIQAWRQKFRQENHGVEPKLWIDKYCIDQNDVQNSLACLPIYLASCSKLVVICGETYLERLWCITELFVYLEMGGSPKNLEVIVLPDPSHRIADKIRNFEPEHAQCYEPETTDILLGVLEAGRYGLEGIRKLVQDRFVLDGWQLKAVSSRRAVKESLTAFKERELNEKESEESDDSGFSI